MSTFYGGDQLADIVEVNSSTTGTKYTTPSGHYAKVVIRRFSSASSASVTLGGAGGFEVGGFHGISNGSFGNLSLSAGSSIETSSNETFGTIGEIWLRAGETISRTGAAGDFNCIIFEYIAP